MSETQAPTQPPKLQGQLPTLGALIEGGKYAGLLTDDDGHAYLLVLLDVRPAKTLTWKAAQKWGAEQGGVLPNRVESAQLYRALKSEFEPEWHWTSEAYGASYAWSCYFNHGIQGYSSSSASGAARAVRRIVL